MTEQASSTTPGSLYRFAGWSAMISGLIGIMAAASLITGVMTRTSVALSRSGFLLFRSHDLGIIIEFCLLIPVAFALHRLSLKRSPGMSRAMLNTGVVLLSFTILLLLLALAKVCKDTLYMFPQGLFGGWLIVFCWRYSGMLSRGLRYFGMVVGIALALVGIFPVGFAIFVNPIILRIPAVAADKYPVSHSTANIILHRILYIGTFGVITLPVWSILLGRRLLRERSS